MSLDNLLESWQVIAPYCWENEAGPIGWYAVCNDIGIVAYFGNESDAFRYRMDRINAELNPYEKISKTRNK